MSNSKVYDPSEANKATVNSIGTSGRIRLEATEEYTGQAFAVMPITADFTYGVGCEASVGDAPAEDEAVSEREFDFWPAEKVVVKTGSAYVYTNK